MEDVNEWLAWVQDLHSKIPKSHYPAASGHHLPVGIHNFLLVLSLAIKSPLRERSLSNIFSLL